jgi:hypothetical protein
MTSHHPRLGVLVDRVDAMLGDFDRRPLDDDAPEIIVVASVPAQVL